MICSKLQTRISGALWGSYCSRTFWREGRDWPTNPSIMAELLFKLSYSLLLNASEVFTHDLENRILGKHVNVCVLGALSAPSWDTIGCVPPISCLQILSQIPDCKILGECVDRRSRSRGQCSTRERNWKCTGTAVRMMDRTGGLGRDEEEEEEEETEATMLICILYPSRRSREEISLAEREKDLWSHQPWWMDGTCSVWSFSAAFLYLISDTLAAAKTLAVLKATDGQKYDILQQQRFIQILAGFPAAAKRVSVYLSYELYSLLWWYLRASDQQFPGRHSELSDW